MRVTVLQKLQRLQKRVRYEDACLSEGYEDVTELVKSATRLYRESYIDPILRELIEREEKREGKRKGKRQC